MVAVLPAHLQDRVLVNTWREQRRPHFLEFLTDSNHVLRSKLPGTPPTDCEFDTIVDEHEAEDWRQFYIQKCSEGSVSFYMEDPATGASDIFIFNAAPEITHRGNVQVNNVSRNLYNVHVSIARL